MKTERNCYAPNSPLQSTPPSGPLMDKAKHIKILEMVSWTSLAMSEGFDGQPFNGKTVAEYFGHQGAAVAALADILKSILEESK